MIDAENPRLLRITQEELNAIARKHAMFRTARVGGMRAILARHDLSGLNLENYDFSHADFTGVSLNGADVRGAQFDYCNLFGADLRLCNLQGAHLVRTDLRGVCMRGATLIGADMAGADLREGMLATQSDGNIVPLHENWPSSDTGGADLSGAILTAARLSGAVASGANFSDATMRNCKIVRANLSGTNFSGANLEGADLSQCDLRNVNLKGAILINAALSLTSLQEAEFANVLTNLPVGPTVKDMPERLEDLLRKHSAWVTSDGTLGSRLDISDYDMRGIKIFAYAKLTLLCAEGAVLYGLDFTEAQLQAASLADADMRFVIAPRADFRGVNMVATRLTNANLQGARFEPLVTTHGRVFKSDLSGANFRYANLQGARFREACLDKTDFSYANLLGADLSGARLEGAIFTGARLNESQEALIARAHQEALSPQ